MTPAWVAPTVRATPWLPLGAAGACLAAVSALGLWTGRWPADLLGVAAAAVASALVAGLRDPAADLLAAVPTSAAVRRARRLVLLVPVGTAVWLAYLAAGQRLVPDLGWPVGPLAALTSVGLAVAVWAPARLAVAAGAGVPVAWIAAAWAGSGLGEDVGTVLLVWQHHPWMVTFAAVAALVMGRDR
jgi:hypothetical protein